MAGYGAPVMTGIERLTSAAIMGAVLAAAVFIASFFGWDVLALLR